jgi:hypothetical protein
MKKKLLVAIGNEFTQQWIESQEKKLRGFKTSAEHCLINQKMVVIGKCIASFFLICGFALFLLGEPYVGGTLIILLGIAIRYCTITAFQQGTTAQKILENWKPIRRKLLKQGLISKCLKVFKRDHPNFDFFPQDYVRILLVKSIDELMGSLSSKYIEATWEGFPKKQEVLKMKMLDLKQLARDLNLNMSFEQYFEWE